MKALKLFSLITTLLLVPPLYAKQLKTEQWLDFERAASPQISPDGSRVLYTRRGIDKLQDKNRFEIWQVNSDGSKHAFVTKGSGVQWSVQGDRIAYIAPDKKGNRQLFVRYMDAEGLTSQITHDVNSPRKFSWSPDGKSIAFVARTKEKNQWNIKLPGKPAGAKWKADPVLIKSLHYRQDRVGITNNGYDHLFVVPSDGGTARQVTSGKWNVGVRFIGAIPRGAISWSADSKNLYFDGQPRENGDLDVFKSLVYKVEVASGKVTGLTPKDGFFHSPRLSPDGKRIAFVGAESWPKDTYLLNHLYVMKANGQNMRQLVGDLSDSPRDLHWSTNSNNIFFTYNHHGSRHIYSTNLSGKVKQLTQGEAVVSLASTSDKDVMAMTSTDPSNAADVYLQKGNKKAKRLTNLNADIFAGVTLGEVKELWYDSTENTKVQSWMVMPPNYDASKKYPMILYIHGGPHAMYNVGFNFVFQELAASGYVVLYTNPRGSTGYGNEFATSIQGIYPGRRDGADLLNGVDAAIASGSVDKDRLFVTGCSGGGVLTTYMVAVSQRFKGAVSRCPVTSWIGMAGYSDVPAWIHRFHKKPFWEDPTDWLENSTLQMVGKVNTPVLLMTGDKDLRTPFVEAEQYFTALKLRGIPTELVAMRGEYHGTGSIPSNWLRTQLYIKAWFKRFDPKFTEAKAD